MSRWLGAPRPARASHDPSRHDRSRSTLVPRPAPSARHTKRVSMSLAITPLTRTKQRRHTIQKPGATTSLTCGDEGEHLGRRAATGLQPGMRGLAWRGEARRGK
eukprot:scaffold1864_cov36-Phaeocystis_antarctica.AAC.1